MITNFSDLIMFLILGFFTVVAFDYGIGYIFDKITIEKTRRNYLK